MESGAVQQREVVAQPPPTTARRRTVTALVVGTVGVLPVAIAVWDHGPRQRLGLLALAVVSVLWAGVLGSRRRLGWVTVPALAAVGAAGVAASVFTGRTTLIVTLVVASVVSECWALTRASRPDGPDPWVVLAGSALMLAAGSGLWVATGSVGLLAASVLVGAAMVFAWSRAPLTFLRTDRAVAERVRSVGSRSAGAVSSVVAAVRTDPRRWTSNSRRVAVAVVVGTVLRLWWVIAMTRTDSYPPEVLGDWYSTWNIRIANQFANGEMPSFEGVHTAFWPPGYGALLAPFAWISQHTGWISLNFAASLLNVALSALTIALCAAVAKEWIGPRASVPAAWIMALAPGHVYASSVAVTEVLIAALLISVTWLVTKLVERFGPTVPARWSVGVGMGIGAAILVSDRTAALVLVPAVAIRALSGKWRGALRVSVLAVVGVVVVLAPWAVRNGVQVGWWSPTATIIPEGMCTAKYGFDSHLLTNTSDDRLMELAEDCVRNSPLDRADLDLRSVVPPKWEFAEPDEAEYARRNMSGSISWFLTHPIDLLRWAPTKIYDAVGNDNSGGYTIATHFGRTELASPRAAQIYQDLSAMWFAFVGVASVVALVRSRLLRRAAPVWFIPLVVLLQPVLGPYAFSRHFLIAYPFLAVMAAVLVGGAEPAEHPDRNGLVAESA